jgi:uncharacterized protein YyaL (SSP411 family)
VSSRSGRTVTEVVGALGRIRPLLFDARAKRPRPHLDDKILTAWNGLMIAACARAGRSLPASPRATRYLDAARRAAGFIRRTLWRDGDQRLLRRYRDGEAAIDGYAEDYAYLTWGLLELFQADGAAAWLEWALALQRQMDERFWDSAEGGWFSTTGRDPSVLLRLKEDYDGAEPAASSVGAMNALTLAHLTGDADMLARAGRTLSRYGPRLGAAARVVPMMMSVLSAWHAGHSQIVIVGDPEGEETRALNDELARHYLPFAITVPVRSGAAQPSIGRLLPFTKTMALVGGRPSAYVCRDFACRPPVNAPDALRDQLADLHP